MNVGKTTRGCLIGIIALSASSEVYPEQLFDRADAAVNLAGSHPGSIMVFLGLNTGRPAGNAPPRAPFHSPSPRVIVGSPFGTLNNARYCAEDWLALYTVDLAIFPDLDPLPLGLNLDGQPIEVTATPMRPQQGFDFPTGGFDIWGSLIGTLSAPLLDEGQDVEGFLKLELGEHTLQITFDGAPINGFPAEITFFVDDVGTDTCTTHCRGMNLPSGCP